MMNVANILLNSSNAALIIFAVAAAIVGIFAKSPTRRAMAGIAILALTLCIPIGSRSIFQWTVSTVERPSFPGFILLGILAYSAVTDRHVETLAEFRFATLMLAVMGTLLYPAATGYLDQDPYVFGYSGYLLPTAVALIIAYALWRGYIITALSLNVAILSFLFSAGASRNLWDYVMDPIAWIIGCGTWIAFAVSVLVKRFRPGDKGISAQPSSGIGETPISH
jgi:hypothetical protein